LMDPNRRQIAEGLLTPLLLASREFKKKHWSLRMGGTGRVVQTERPVTTETTVAVPRTQ
jgi:hypothetical protein